MLLPYYYKWVDSPRSHQLALGWITADCWSCPGKEEEEKKKNYLLVLLI